MIVGHDSNKGGRVYSEYAMVVVYSLTLSTNRRTVMIINLNEGIITWNGRTYNYSSEDLGGMVGQFIRKGYKFNFCDGIYTCVYEPVVLYSS